MAASVNSMIDLLQVKPHLLAIDSKLWDSVTSESRLFSRTAFTSWCPLLRTEQERTEFEEMANLYLRREQEKEPEVFVCHICGSASREVSTPSQIVEISGFGPLECGDLQSAGYAGLIDVDSCIDLSLIHI